VITNCQHVDCASRLVTALKDWGQVAAWIGAALFFGYKAFAGYFIIDLSLKLDCERTRMPNGGRDYLRATVTVKKGERGAIELHDLRAAIFDYHTGAKIGQSQLLKGVRRLTYGPGEYGSKEVKPEAISEKHPLLNFAFAPSSCPSFGR